MGPSAPAARAQRRPISMALADAASSSSSLPASMVVSTSTRVMYSSATVLLSGTRTWKIREGRPRPLLGADSTFIAPALTSSSMWPRAVLTCMPSSSATVPALAPLGWRCKAASTSRCFGERLRASGKSSVVGRGSESGMVGNPPWGLHNRDFIWGGQKRLL